MKTSGICPACNKSFKLKEIEKIEAVGVIPNFECPFCSVNIKPKSLGGSYEIMGGWLAPIFLAFVVINFYINLYYVAVFTMLAFILYRTRIWYYVDKFKTTDVIGEGHMEFEVNENH